MPCGRSKSKASKQTYKPRKPASAKKMTKRGYLLAQLLGGLLGWGLGGAAHERLFGDRGNLLSILGMSGLGAAGGVLGVDWLAKKIWPPKPELTEANAAKLHSVLRDNAVRAYAELQMLQNDLPKLLETQKAPEAKLLLAAANRKATQLAAALDEYDKAMRALKEAYPNIG